MFYSLTHKTILDSHAVTGFSMLFNIQCKREKNRFRFWLLTLKVMVNQGRLSIRVPFTT